MYEDGKKNDWHYVEITPVPESPFILEWSNAAGYSWRLTQSIYDPYTFNVTIISLTHSQTQGS